ncbi:MAG: mandelate racemase [Chloroflexota bacterium]|nr:mandelate racemase [Chloroflexota bacterium]
MRISNVTVTPVAIPLEAPLWSSEGVTAPQALRTILQIATDDGLVGLGEVGPRITQDRIKAAIPNLLGEDPFGLERLRARFARGKFYSQEAAGLYAAIEMACLDIQGKAIGRPVCDLLGGRLRDDVAVIAYLYRREASDGHPSVRTPDEIVAHTRDLVARYGFGTIKLKGGTSDPASDIEAVLALRAAFPNAALRLDPNAMWSVETSLAVASAIKECKLEWLEDPTPGLDGMAEVTRRGGIPTATNMCLTHPRELPQALRLRAVDVVLYDLWYWSGLREAKGLADMCQVFGLGLGIHAGGGSYELGIGLAAMVHMASALPMLVHAMDITYHQLGDDILTEPLRIEGGHIAVPTGPGLGVDCDPARLERYAELYRETEAQRAAKRHDPSRPAWLPIYPSW